MAATKVLITVKTYPAISQKYDELVCTAGFREDGTWIRVYPIPFRKLDYGSQYKKYDWIELDLVKNTSDFRPESYRPTNFDEEIKIIGHLDTANKWKLRKEIALKKVYTNLSSLIRESRDRTFPTSLAVFKPTKVLDFVYEEEGNKEWDSHKLESLSQLNLFEKSSSSIQVVRKLPFKFSFVFLDDEGRRSKLMIEDWETGQLYWNCLENYKDASKACQDVRRKYFDDFALTKDLHFFLGTTKLNHYVSRNPFIIIGTFHPPMDYQTNLF
jgi:hypothetical protein